MASQVLSGAGIGIVVATLSWRGNTTPHLVSVFPDGLNFVILAALLVAAIYLDLRRPGPHDRRASFRSGLIIASAAGLVLGSVVTAMGIVRFSEPFASLLIFGFLSAIAWPVAIGVAASALMPNNVRETV